MGFAYPVAVVLWGDAHENTEPMDEEDIEHAPKIQATVGWLIRQDETGITLATEYGEEDGELRTVNFIPAGMAVSVKVIV